LFLIAPTCFTVSKEFSAHFNAVKYWGRCYIDGVTLFAIFDSLTHLTGQECYLQRLLVIINDNEITWLG